MDLTILGCGGTWPGKGGACSGYLVREDGFNLWIDLGTGTLANLQRTIDEYSNDADTVNTYHGRVEYRLWWTRQYSTGPLLHRECFHGVA